MQKTSKARNLFILLLLLYLATIAWLCFGHFDNTHSIAQSFFGIPTDKIVHFCMFLPFPLILWGIFRGVTKKPWHSVVLVLLFFLAGCIVAGSTELGQGLTKYRTADSADFMADGIGLATGAIAALIMDLRSAFEKRKN